MNKNFEEILRTFFSRQGFGGAQSNSNKDTRVNSTHASDCFDVRLHVEDWKLAHFVGAMCFRGRRRVRADVGITDNETIDV